MAESRLVLNKQVWTLLNYDLETEKCNTSIWVFQSTTSCRFHKLLARVKLDSWCGTTAQFRPRAVTSLGHSMGLLLCAGTVRAAGSRADPQPYLTPVSREGRARKHGERGTHLPRLGGEGAGTGSTSSEGSFVTGLDGASSSQTSRPLVKYTCQGPSVEGVTLLPECGHPSFNAKKIIISIIHALL